MYNYMGLWAVYNHMHSMPTYLDAVCQLISQQLHLEPSLIPKRRSNIQSSQLL